MLRISLVLKSFQMCIVAPQLMKMSKYHRRLRKFHTVEQTLSSTLKSGENFANVWNEYLSRIDLHLLNVEHDCIVKTFQNDILKSQCSKADGCKFGANDYVLQKKVYWRDLSLFSKILKMILIS